MIVLEPRGQEATPVLATARLVLRAPAAADAQALSALVNDRRIAENTARIPHPYRLPDAEQFIASANTKAGAAEFVVTLRDGTLVGGCGIAANGGAPEIGYWFGLPYWGHGYATEAARAVIDYAFTALGVSRLEAGARISNPASRRVLEKCGFQWTGVRLMRVRAINSAAPTDRFRLDRRLWESLRSWGRVTRVA